MKIGSQCLILVALVLLVTTDCVADETSLKLQQWSAKHGDQPVWKLREFDDSGWTNIHLPVNLWSELGGWHLTKPTAWLRTTFRLPGQLKDKQLGLQFSSLSEAANIYLNDIEISQFGFPSSNIDLNYASSGPGPKMAIIPVGLLNYDQANTLAIRVQSGSSRLGIVYGDVTISELEQTISQTIQSQRQYITLELAWLIALLFTAFLLLIADFALKAPLQNVYLFGGLLFIVITFLVSDSALGSSLGWLVPGSYLKSLVYAWIAVALIFLHIAKSSKRKIAYHDYFLAGVLVIGGLLERLFFIENWLQIEIGLLTPTLVIIVCFMGYYVVKSWRGQFESSWLGAIFCIMGVQILFESVALSLFPPKIADYWLEALLYIAVLGLLVKASTDFFIRLRQREEFAGHLLVLQESERKRVAGDLHDSLGQQLALVNWRIEEQVPQQEVRDTLNELIQEALQELRRIVWNLRPTKLRTLGFIGALEKLSQQYPNRNIDVSNVVESVVTGLTDVQAIQLFRIIQESLSNAVKHGSASDIDISMIKTEGYYRLKINDNGRGFNTKQTKSSGLGLTTMIERATVLGGDCKITSVVNKGCTVSVQIPVND